jgi:putative DNA modification/repair radical SAM protein
LTSHLSFIALALLLALAGCDRIENGKQRCAMIRAGLLNPPMQWGIASRGEERSPILYDHPVELKTKLEILADAAKYDASCASSGGSRRNSVDGRGVGSNEGAGICHSYAPDGRCISLLKILLTNFCQYDCLYCVNRASSNVPRARFSIDEVVQLTLDFYRRNCIEGLFLSSGIIRSPDYTMEQVVEVARVLREEHDFRGYIHLKTIPEASAELLQRAGRYADRLSINIELPTEHGLAALAPEKDGAAIRRSMGRLRLHIDEARGEARDHARAAPASMPGVAPTRARPQSFAAAGQSTQMIVGADAADDASILTTSAQLYGAYRLKRVYYSAFSPIPDASASLPLQAPPLMREHRLYQADWLMRFYGFEADEIAPQGGDGMLSLEVDPKLAWAIAHPERFPVDLNLAPRELLLRVPGLGVKAVGRLLLARRGRQVRAVDLGRLRVPSHKVLPFVITADHRPGTTVDANHALARGAQPRAAQASLF